MTHERIRVKVASMGAARKSPNLMMYYVDPITEKRVSRSTGTTDRTEANRNAAVWEDELNSGRYASPNRVTWAEFRERYENEKLAELAEATQDAAASALNHLERILQPKRLTSVSADAISRLKKKLREEGMKDTTLAAHLRHLGAAFNWAESIRLLHKAPRIEQPKRVKGRKMMRGRPITAEEFERMIDAAEKVRPDDSGTWTYYLRGLWLSGLRLEESLILSWDHHGIFTVDLSGRHPRFRIYAEAEKGNQDRLLPMTPDFADFLLETPEEDRTGPVFKMPGLLNGEQLSDKRVSRIITKIGTRAGVVVDRTTKKVRERIEDPETGKMVSKPGGRLVDQEAVKYASAHDLRRAFGTRWAPRVKPATLRLLMRHSSIETTLRYYVEQDADEVADELWKTHQKNGAPTPAPTPTPPTVQKPERAASE